MHLSVAYDSYEYLPSFFQKLYFIVVFMFYYQLFIILSKQLV